MMLYISMKFHENILNDFQVILRTKNYNCRISKGEKLQKCIEIRGIVFLCSARRLMMFYISMKFHENILNGFQIIEKTQNYHCRISKGNKSKMYRQELWFLCSLPRLVMLYISMKFHENVLNGFQRKRNCNVQTQTRSRSILFALNTGI